MKHLGDITKINWREVEPADVVTGSARWASEIEEFCIAVTKERIGT